MTTVENRSATTRPGGVTGAGFLPGVSGNPGGRPKGLARRVRDLVGDDGAVIADYMLAVMRDDRERTRDRLEAARFLADRGWGKPVQAVELDVATLSPALDPDRLASLSTEELDLLIGLAEKGFLTLEQASDCPHLSRGGRL